MKGLNGEGLLSLRREKGAVSEIPTPRELYGMTSGYFVLFSPV